MKARCLFWQVVGYSIIIPFVFKGLSEISGSEADTNAQKYEAFINEIEEKVSSTLMDGASSPIGFSGEGRLKIQFHDLRYYPKFMESDRSWIQSGWEGNEGLLRLGMIASIGRNVTFYSKIGFQNTLPGFYTNNSGNSDANNPGFALLQYVHDVHDFSAYIHEDLKAGIALRTSPASFMLNFGGIQWIEMSPFTVWEHQRRLFAWDYLPYEIEESPANYFDKNTVKGERSDRAAWHKKPFYGLGLESIELPHEFLLNMMYGTVESFDRHEREYVSFTDDLAYFEPADAAKVQGIGDSYRHVFLVRLSKNNTVGDLTPGLNFTALRYDSDVLSSETFKKFLQKNDTCFYKQPWVISADVNGKASDSLSLHCEAAIGEVDTDFIVSSTKSQYVHSSKIRPAFFSGLTSGYVLPAQLEIIYVAPGFYSPFSFAKSVDAFFPFGANLTGPGDFVASQYNQNLTGFNFHLSAPGLENSGHCKVTFGHHVQVQAGPDILFFPYRLNGPDLWTFFQNSYTRWGVGLLDATIDKNNLYRKRLGDETGRDYWPQGGPEEGGIRSNTMGIYEGFVPYGDAAHAQGNYDDMTATIFRRSSYVPFNRKHTFNLELDATYDISRRTGLTKSMYLSIYSSINGVSTTPVPVAFSEKSIGMLLWGAIVRFEPAVEMTEKFYLLGLAGYENWRSDKSWMLGPDNMTVVRCPIDYRDMAFGFGFDWQMLERMGLHGRFKWMRHQDVDFSSNDWETPIISTEIKMWF
jgi:hypothetical protein